ncbi:macro domain-containing protein [Streptomyces avicenniae]|uniref:macro domain-containing protein n=1 Tax=Streptomyces avicenniae TaxID=500153 RepID=UPI00167E6774|nr:macro domain-containing protein [Streptomyces avicenniae]
MRADALAHGVNCAGAMGRGIAVEFRDRWPGMYEEYRARCRAGRLAPGGVFPWRAPDGPLIYNLGTQQHWRTPAQLPDVRAAFAAMVAHADAHAVRRVALPRVAAGLGGLPWDEVLAALRAEADGAAVSLTVVTPPDPPPAPAAAP